MIYSLFSREINLSLRIYLTIPIFSVSFVTVSELFCAELLENFAFLSAILVAGKSPVASAVFWIAVYEVVLSLLS